MKLTRLLVIAVLCFAGSSFCHAQDDDPIVGMGFTPFGSYHGGDLDSVNLSNNFLNVHIPLLSLPQRGDISYTAQIMYVPQQWSVVPNCSNQNTCSPRWQKKKGGFSIDTMGPDNFGASEGPYVSGSKVNVYRAGTDDGSIHQMGTITGRDGAITLDGTGIWSDITTIPPNNGTARDKHGRLRTSSSNFEDSNGNSFSLSADGLTMFDTLGRSLPAGNTTVSDSSGCTGSLPIASAYTVSFPGYNGQAQQVKVCVASIQLQTNFIASGYFNDLLFPIAEASATTGVTQSIVIFNGVSWTSSLAWTFEYNDRDPGDALTINYGDVTKITMPTGGSISYTWQPIIPCDPNAPSPGSRGVATRTVNANDGNPPQTWTYSTSGTVTDPRGYVTAHVFSGLGGSCSLYETETRYYQGAAIASNLRKTVDTTYRYMYNPWDLLTTGPATVTNVFPTVVTTTWPSGKTSRIEKDYDNNLAFTVEGVPHQYSGASYGELMETREFDYDGSLLRRTDYTYKAFDGSSNSSAYLTANLLDRVSSVTTYDGGGNQVAKVTYGYDESAVHGAFIATQFDAATGNTYARGNRTSEGHWLNTTGGMVTTNTSYFDTGKPYQVTDPGGHAVTFTYGSGFQSGTNFIGGYLTQAQNALQQNAFIDYDFNSGLQIASKDANGAQTASTFDAYERIKSKTTPDGTSLWNYTDSQPPFFTASSGPNPSTQTYTAEGDLDELGRNVRGKLTSDPSGTDITDTTYDVLGRVATVSNPHRSTSSPTDGITSTAYDALGRVTATTYQDGSVSTTDYTQFPTITVTDPAGNVRQSRTDALGRLVEVDEPGSHFVPDQPATGPTFATGTVTISGTEQSQQGQTAPAVASTGTITIGGSEKQGNAKDCAPGDHCPMWDEGSVTLNINGHAIESDFSQGVTQATVVQNLVNGINAISGMTATFSGSVITFHMTDGSNPSFTTGMSNSITITSFTISPTPSGTMTGGVPAQFGPTYDTGTVSVIVNGTTYSTSSGQTSTASSIASALAAGMTNATLSATSAPCSPVTSTCGATITVSSVATGASTNYSLSSSASSTLHSFSAVASGASLAGGTNGAPDVPAHTTWSGWAATLYKYDALGNLYCVEQHADAATGTGCPSTPPDPNTPVPPDPNNAWRRRLFGYDSLSRLLWASNPESGVITYSYDVDGNLLQKKSPPPNNQPSPQYISYCYDALHRVTGKAYSQQNCVNGLLPAGTAAVSYFYDQTSYNGMTIANGAGRRTGMADQAGFEAWSYDPMGRPLFDSRTTAGVSKTTGYTYDFMGNVKSLTYPSGAQVTYTYNAANQAISAADSANSINYATAGLYSPPGALTSVTNGANITSVYYDNPRLQPCRISVSASGATPSGCTDATIGNIMDVTYNFGAAGMNNGNVMSIANNRDSSRSQNFTYDPLNRISTAQTTYSTTGANCWGETYGYDGWGNMLTLAGMTPQYSGCTQESGFGVGANGSNQLSASSYDAAGNTMLSGYTYDAENRLSLAGGVTYTYDGDGKRVEKSSGKIYWYGMGSDVLEETDLTGSTTDSGFNEYVFFDGKRTARRNSSNTVFYYLADHLGTSRTIVQSGQTTPCYDGDYYPFGGERSLTNTCSQNYEFTGKERDSETQLDYFGARYYSNGLARFNTPDWAARATSVPYAEFADPQSLNLYTYVGNNPLSRTDADGHLTIIVPGTWNNHKDWDNSNFKKQVSKTFGEKAIVLNNNGMGNSKEARAAAAKQLEDLIRTHTFAPGEKLNIVTHSHGGNVVALATEEGLPHKIDHLVTLGVPVRGDYPFIESLIGQHLNVFSYHDDVQRAGGEMETVQTPVGLYIIEIPANRQINQGGVINVDATSTASGHSDLWEDPRTWDTKVQPKIR